MISVENALKIVSENTPVLAHETVALNHAWNRVLAFNLDSKIDIPNFSQSAMDGYALNTQKDVEPPQQFKVVGEVAAGDESGIELKSGECVRIFTGAAVPPSASTVIMQEHVSRTENMILVNKPVKLGANVRQIGEQISKNDTGLQKGTLLSAAGVGFCAMMGYHQVPVIKQPRVHVLVTGNELVSPGQELPIGKIYESNSVTLVAALKSYGLDNVYVTRVKDNLPDTIVAIKTAVDVADLVLVSGGISVGDYDFVNSALAKNGVEEKFYKVNQKPGKPLFYGKKKNCSVFALPGNPASALTNFYFYVVPVIHKMMGLGFVGCNKKQAIVTEPIKIKGTRAQFLKGFIHEGSVDVLEGQSSAMMHSYAVANCLVYVSENQKEISSGSEVVVYMLP